MLRCSTRAVFTNRNEVTRFGSLNISWHPLCSQAPGPDNGGDSGGPSKSEKEAVLSSSSNAPVRSKVYQAVNVVSKMADLKRSEKISEADYISDSRF